MENHETFFARVRPLFPPSEELQIRLAYIMAKAGHRNQFRKELDENGNPVRYFEHPRRVAVIILDELDIADCDMIVSAFLHDGLEDIKGLTPEMLETYFNKEVCRMVKLLTKDQESKDIYWSRLMKRGGWKAITIKACDRLDNLRSLGDTTPEFIKKQLKETKEKLYPLLDELYELMPDRDKAIYLRSEIRSKVQELDV